ncbi:hypothetical protein M3Y96_00073300 [Aphelenchoides besseyi]|nr:hypothetical protein M3Y96_00073300 [Aphelenchoides besseyi]
MAFLDAIFERKDLLFGRFSAKLTTVEKNEHWEQVRSQLVSHGFSKVPTTESLRGVHWQNLQRRAKEKRDKNKRTGNGGVKMTDIDNRVLDILGRESPVVIGLPVADTSRSQTSIELSSGDNLGEEVSNSVTSNSADEPTSLPPPSSQVFGRQKKRGIKESSDKLKELKKRKIEAEIVKLESETSVNRAFVEKLKSEADLNRSLADLNRLEFQRVQLSFGDEEIVVETTD